MNYDELKKMAKKLADEAKMPYCWEDVMNRLISGKPLPFKIDIKDERIRNS